MPLQRGKSADARSQNIKELLHKWKRTGKIGTSSPKTMGEARKQAAAIAYKKSREG